MGKSNFSKYLIVFGLLLIMFGINKYSKQVLATGILGNQFYNKVDYNLYKYTTEDGSKIKVVGDYIIEIKEEINEFSYDGDVIDLKGNLVYEGVFGKNVIQGIDGFLYYYPLDLDANNRYLYKLHDGISERVSSEPISGYITFNDNLKKINNEGLFTNTNYNVFYGYYINKNGNSDIYYLQDNKFNKVSFSGNYDFSIPSLLDNKLNYKYIAVGDDNSKYGIYDLLAKKYIVSNKYNKIKFLRNNLLVACQESKCGVIDLYENIMLKFTYDDIYVDNYSSNYILARNSNRYDLYDSSLNKLLSFRYDLKLENEYDIRKIGSNYVIYSSSMTRNRNYEVLFVKDNGYYKVMSANELHIYDDLIVIYDKETKVISGYDEYFKNIYEIEDSNIKKDMYESNFKINKPVIKIEDKLYDIENGKKVSNDTNYVELVGDGIKIYHSGDKLYLMINEEKYSIGDDNLVPDEYYVSKTDNGYYFVADYTSSYSFVYLEKN